MKIKRILLSLLILMFPIVVNAANVTYSNVTSTLNTFYNSLSNKNNFIYQTNKFLCTGTSINISCAASATYSNIGLLNLSEYDAIGGVNSYLSSINSYWTMTESGSSAYQINSSGSELKAKTSTAGIKPIVYVKNTVEVNGKGSKKEPYTLIDPSEVSLGKTYDFSYTENYQTFTVPETATYRIELWGAQGADFQSIEGGHGGYTKGDIRLTKNTNLYIYIGGKPSSGETGGYNGGGSITTGQSNWGGRPGGGATDVRLTSGTWNDFNSLKSRIMVAGGGGGANNRNYADQGCGYGQGEGGVGGGLTGGTGITTGHTYNGCTYGWGVGTGGTQTSGGHYIEYNSSGVVTKDILTAAFGYGGGTATYTAADTQTGGGGGYYGGGLSGHGGAGGGSSFISGLAGCNAISSSSTSNKIIHTSQPNHYSGYVFSNPQTIAGDANMPNPSGGTEVGHTGNGFARITLIAY